MVIRKLRAALSACPGLEGDPLPFEDGRYRLSEAFEVKCDALTLRVAPDRTPSSRFLPEVHSKWALERQGDGRFAGMN